jgi:hypothetical protein
MIKKIILIVLFVAMGLDAMISNPKGVNCWIIRETELGQYDSIPITVTFSIRDNKSQTVYVRTIDYKEYWLHEPKERLIKR